MTLAESGLKMLHEIFERHGTDKATHGYAKVYEPLLNSRRLEVRRVLEVGIGTLDPDAPSSMHGYAAQHYSPGGSLRAWREYFPAAVIWGLDTMLDTQFADDRIVTRLGDSTDKAQVDNALGDTSFDLIIDDGDHRFECQRATLENLWDRVNLGGFYVIEDIGGFHVDDIMTVLSR
jgi:Methyltransferase domain